MSSEKMRKGFEAWAGARWGRKTLLRINHPGSPSDGDYELGNVDDCWESWQAAIASLEVELPSEYDCCAGTTSYEIREMAIESVKSIGLKVKP